jgi:hypothetical protein
MECAPVPRFLRRVCRVSQRRNCSNARRDNVLSYRVTGSPLSSVWPPSRRSFGLASTPYAKPRRSRSHRRSQPRRRMHRTRPGAPPGNARADSNRGPDTMGPRGGELPHRVERRALHGTRGVDVRAQRFGPGVCALRIARSPRLRSVTLEPLDGVLRWSALFRYEAAGTSSSARAARVGASLRA